MRSNIAYPKEMREKAKREGLHLVTMSVPGMTIQAPATSAEARKILKFMTLWLKKDR